METENIMQVSVTQKGMEKIIYNGYAYNYSNRNEEFFRWYCDKRSLNGCTGKLCTKKINDIHTFVKIDEHNHEPDPTRFDVLEVRRNIKKRSLDSMDNPCSVIQAEIVKCDPRSRQYIASNSALKQIVKNTRKSNKKKEPKTIEEIEIPEELKFIEENKFVHYCESVNNDFLVILTTKQNMELLSTAEFWIMDGTFDITPNLFSQLYSIHAKVGFGINFEIMPLVFVLMTKKSESLYDEMFKALQNIAGDYNLELNPSYILNDFEKATINSVAKSFPETINKGCYFHLGKNIKTAFDYLFLIFFYFYQDKLCGVIYRNLAWSPNMEMTRILTSI